MSTIKTLCQKPGKHHWLNWTTTMLAIVVFYLGFNLLSAIPLRQTRLIIAHQSHLSLLVPDGLFIVIGLLFIGFIYGLNQYQTTVAPNRDPLAWGRLLKIDGLSFAAILIISSLGAIIGAMLHAPAATSVNQTELDQLMKIGGPATIWMFIDIAIIAPVLEEFVFRFMLIGPAPATKPMLDNQPTDRRKLYAIISACLFTYLHVGTEFQAMASSYFMNSAANATFIKDLIPYAGIALILTLIYYKTSNIWYSIITHATWNTIVGLAMFSAIMH